MSSRASAVFQLLGWCTDRPFSLANSLSGSSARPALSGAQNTPTTFSLRSSSFSSTALPKASCPCTTIRITSSAPRSDACVDARLAGMTSLRGRLFCRLGGARGLDRGDLLGRVAEHIAQDLFGVLAEQRRTLHLGGTGRELDRVADRKIFA